MHRAATAYAYSLPRVSICSCRVCYSYRLVKGASVEGIFQVNANIITDKLGIPVFTRATRHTDVAISGAFIAQLTSPDTFRCCRPLPVYQAFMETSLHGRFFHVHISGRYTHCRIAWRNGVISRTTSHSKRRHGEVVVSVLPGPHVGGVIHGHVRSNHSTG